MATAKTTVKKTTAVKTAVVKKTAAVGMSGTKLAPAKALTKADLQEKVAHLEKALKGSEDMRLTTVAYRDRLAVEKGGLAARNAELVKEKKDLMDTQVKLQTVITNYVADVERLLTENKHLKQGAVMLDNSRQELQKTIDNLQSDNKHLGSTVTNKNELLDAVTVEARSAAMRLNKVPGWIRSIFGA